MSALTVSARENFAACVATMVLTAIAVFTRFGMRFSLGQRLLGSDWLCLLSLVFFYAYCIVIINCTHSAVPLSPPSLYNQMLTTFSYFQCIKVPCFRCWSAVWAGRAEESLNRTLSNPSSQAPRSQHSKLTDDRHRLHSRYLCHA